MWVFATERLSRVDFWMAWRYHGFPRFHFLFFCLEPTVRRNSFLHGYGKYIEIDILEVTWSLLCSKFFLSNYEAHWQQHLKDTLQLKILRTSINLRDNSFLGKYQEKLMKVPGKLSVTQKSNPVLQRMLDQGISLIIIFFFFSQTNVIF